MLTGILPPAYRKGFYAAYALVGVVLGAVQVAYLNIAGQPQWLTVALLVYAFVGTAFGATAGSNITTQAYQPLLPSAEEIAAAVSAHLATPVARKPAKKAAPTKVSP